MQMIIYQVMTDGSMDIPHISAKVPFLETALIDRGPLDRIPSPRLMKTHLRPWRFNTAKSKYIHVVRNAEDVFYSYYKFYQSHEGYKGSIGDFFNRFRNGTIHYGKYLSHANSWKKLQRKPNYLFLRYEDIHSDKVGAIRIVAQFCGKRLTDEDIERVVARSNFDYMKQQEAKFDFLNEVSFGKGRIPGQFIRSGVVGEGKESLDANQSSTLSDWDKSILSPVHSQPKR